MQGEGEVWARVLQPESAGRERTRPRATHFGRLPFRGADAPFGRRSLVVSGDSARGGGGCRAGSSQAGGEELETCHCEGRANETVMKRATGAGDLKRVRRRWPAGSVSGVVVLFVACVGLSAATLEGAGATFPAPLYQRWIETFLAQRPQDRIRYEGIGSGDGLRQLGEGKIDFPGSDVCQTPAGRLAADFLCMPTVAGGVVPIFNLPCVAEDLRLTPEALAAIYLGKVREWNDKVIRDANHGASLPNRDIVVIYRSDSSGTSYAWSDYLSKISDEWKQNVGAGTDLKWPAGEGAAGNEGVAQAVQKTPGSLGYVELIYAVRHHLGMAAVRNASGHYVRADLESVSAAAVTATAGFSAAAPPPTLTNSPVEKAYPIATFS